MDANTVVQTMNAIGIKSTNIGGVEYRLPRISTPIARKMQLRISKAMGAPIANLMSSGLTEAYLSDGESENADEEFINSIGNMFSGVLSNIDEDVVAELLTDMVELTYSGKTQSKTSHENDFDYNEVYDVELAVWVAEQLFGNFIKGLLQSHVAENLMNALGLEKKENQAKTEES